LFSIFKVEIPLIIIELALADSSLIWLILFLECYDFEIDYIFVKKQIWDEIKKSVKVTMNCMVT